MNSTTKTPAQDYVVYPAGIAFASKAAAIRHAEDNGGERVEASRTLKAVWKRGQNFEIRLTNVPDGAYREDYLGRSRYCTTLAEARRAVAQFNRAKRQHPEDFEPEMEAEVVAL